MESRARHCKAICGKEKGEFVRTSNRHDYALKPTGLTALNALKDSGLDVISVGKSMIFSAERALQRHSAQKLGSWNGADH